MFAASSKNFLFASLFTFAACGTTADRGISGTDEQASNLRNSRGNEARNQEKKETEAPGVTAPTRWEHQFTFVHDIETLELLDPKSDGAIVLDDVTRALLDPGAFITNGIVLLNDEGVLQRYGLCSLIDDDPAWMYDCQRDFGALINAVMDHAFSQSQGAAAVRQAMEDAAYGLRHAKLSAVLTVRSQDLESDAVTASLQWNAIHLPEPTGTIDLAALGISPLAASFAGEAVKQPNGTYALMLQPAQMQLAYGHVVMAVLQKVIMPRLAPNMDRNQDEAVSLAEMFSAMENCSDLSSSAQSMCHTGAQAMATLIQSGLLAKLEVSLPEGFVVELEGTLQLDDAQQTDTSGVLPTTAPATLTADVILQGAKKSKGPQATEVVATSKAMR